jgi:hypothetical protein
MKTWQIIESIDVVFVPTVMPFLVTDGQSPSRPALITENDNEVQQTWSASFDLPEVQADEIQDSSDNLKWSVLIIQASDYPGSVMVSNEDMSDLPLSDESFVSAIDEIQGPVDEDNSLEEIHDDPALGTQWQAQDDGTMIRRSHRASKPNPRYQSNSVNIRQERTVTIQDDEPRSLKEA